MSIKNPERSLDRFAYIETELFWGNGLTAGQLARAFKITRQMAQRIIDQYRRQFPAHLRYDASRKRHEATDSFEPTFVRPSPLAFLDYLRGQALVGLYRAEQDWSELAVTDVDRLLRPDLPLNTIRMVLAALRRQKSVMIDYRKKDLELGSISVRVISPNHLVFAEGRYHIRAYCHLKKLYLDFVLSRIAYAEASSEEWVPTTDDREWQEFTTLKLEPNPSLPVSVRTAILKGYEKGENGTRTIRCRRALAYYISRKLLADDPKYEMPLWKITTKE
jgi:predicted DNA-binding transcriptional regulator YafY